MFLQPARKKLRLLDDSSRLMRIEVLLIAGLVLFGILAFRLWYLQILTGDQYVAVAATNRERTIPVEALRGVIYDRNGQTLVGNRGGLSVGLLRMYMPDPTKNQAALHHELTRLATLLGMPVADVQKAYDQAKTDPYTVKVLKEDVPLNPVVDYLKEDNLEFPGVEVDISSLRSYPDKSLAAQILGYVGLISQSDRAQQQFAQVALTDHVGKDGVERTYDRFLRGTDGYKTVEVDAAGQPLTFLADIPPADGDNLTLTLDSSLQQAAEAALAAGIKQAHLQKFTSADGGAVVALDPHTGQVLAMASYPSYDPSLWAGGMNSQMFAQLNSKQANDPFLNRAIDGRYPVGSTFKPFVAATALNAGIITPTSTFLAPGTFSAAGHTWKDWNPNPLGDVNVVQALEQSVDVFFYNVGYQLYQQTGPVLQDGVRQFGFGLPTGIDLPGENGGRVPDKDWKAKVGKTAIDKAWTPGDDINLAIGQGDLLATPLQVAVAFSAIANGGDVWVPHLGLELTDASGNVVHTFDNQKAGHVDMPSSTLGAIRKGLGLVVSDPTGTAYQEFRSFPVAVAGKTGTAQMPPGDAEAWFAGYAPADNPQIVVVALVEHGGHGSSVAAPIVREVMAAYFHAKSAGTSTVRATE